MSNKYSCLENHLRSIRSDRITLSFREIEKLIGGPLPKSAYEHRPWWANQSSTKNRPQAAAWLNAGFKVCELHQMHSTSRVTFERSRESAAAYTQLTRAEHSQQKALAEIQAAATFSISSKVTRPIVLVSCVKLKRKQSCIASEMYISTLFRGMMAYAKSLQPKSIFILSAKYGLLKLDDQIEPYEQTLKCMKALDKSIWAKHVISSLRQVSDLETDHFVILAGLEYRKLIVSHLKHVEVPMEGFSFGKQLQWLQDREA